MATREEIKQAMVNRIIQEGLVNPATNQPMPAMDSVLEAVTDGIVLQESGPGFGKVKIGSNTLEADTVGDTLELVAGANIALTPDVANDRVTVSVTGTVPSAQNADTVDGKHASDFALLGHGHTGGADGNQIGTSGLQDGAVTDPKVGNRTIDQTQAPTGNTGTLTQLFSWIANRIKAITGAANWFDNPVASIAAIWAKFNATTGHKHTGGADDGPKIDYNDLINKPNSLPPSAHASTHMGGSDPITPAGIGAVNKAGDKITGALEFRIDNTGPFYHRHVASYTADMSSAKGAFVIETPIFAESENTMMRVLIEGYFYDTTSPFWLLVGGYIYPPNLAFYNCGYINLGKKRPLVRWGRNTSTGKVVLIIGDVADVYSYPKLWVSLLEGYVGAKDAHRTGWSISQKTDLTGYDLLTTVPDVGAFWHAGNDGAGSGLDADMVDGKHLTNLVQNAGSTPSIQAGADASKPAAGTAGRLYLATDTHILYRDSGTAWVKMAAVNWENIDGKPSTFTPSAHKTTHASGGSDALTPSDIGAETPSGAQAKVDSHASATQTHGASGSYYLAKTSRSDQLPGWADIPDKPSSFTPVAHKSTHASGGSDALTPADIGAVNKAGDTMTGTLTVPDLLVNNNTVWHAGNLNINRWVQPGDTILLEALTQRSTDNTGVTMVKAFRVLRPGRYRITGEACVYSGGATTTVWVEANGIIQGSFGTTSGSYVSFTIDMTVGVEACGIIYVYLKTTAVNFPGYIRNVRLKYTDGSELAPAVVKD